MQMRLASWHELLKSSLKTGRRAVMNKIVGGAVIAMTLAFSPAMAMAEEEATSHDARLEGYTQKVALDGGSTALTWLLLVVLGLLCLGVLFKDAKRTHLD